MLTIPIDLWLRHSRMVGAVVKRVIDLADDDEGDTEMAKKGLNMWRMIVQDMEIIQAGKNVGAQIEVV